MVSIFFYCSSPYVGYTLKKADYAIKEMRSVSEKDMTTIGYKLFNSSGSYMVLGKFGGQKYFHTRQSQSENYDEQGRRIYTNVAFVGDDVKDEVTINKIALYVAFNEQIFYKQIADMIMLLNDGFTIDFDKLNSFIRKIEGSNISFTSNNPNAQKFYNDVLKCNNKELSFVITESTWDYFKKQAKYDFNESVLYKMSLQDVEYLREGSNCKLNDSGSNDDSNNPPTSSEDHGVQTAPTQIVSDVKNDISTKANSTDASNEKDSEIEKLKQDINNICAERNNLESEIRELNRKISDLQKENSLLKNGQKKLKLISILKGVIGTVFAVLIILILRWIFK